MAHRGPDDAGEWTDSHAVDRSSTACDHGSQSRPGADRPQRANGDPGPTIVVFNGELLNHLELRAALEAEGERFRNRLRCRDRGGGGASLGRAGARSFQRDVRDRAGTGRGIGTASGCPRSVRGRPADVDRGFRARRTSSSSRARSTPILEHPAVRRRVDPITLSAYLSTIRITLGERTMVDGVRTVRPGGLVSSPTDGGTRITATIDAGGRRRGRPVSVTGAAADDLVRQR